jgi:hypothetical protein
MNDLFNEIISSSAVRIMIIGAIFSWLGKRYLDRILEAERNTNKEMLAALQHDISKELEDHKSKLKLNEKFLDSQFEASFKLYKIMIDIVPNKHNPEMDWYEACDDIAMKFGTIKEWLSEFLAAHYTTLPSEIFKRIQETENLCSNGSLAIHDSEPHIPSHLNERAELVFENIRTACFDLKSYIDGQREK